MKLDLSSFEKALASLKIAWTEFQKDTSNYFVQDSVIQRFEYTYEFCHKTLKRFLIESEFNGQEIKTMSFADIIRTSSEKGLLLNDLSKWIIYREMRNITSHTYEESKAGDVVSIVNDFIKDADYLLTKIKEKNA
ncbi:hypothetical protein AGMMS50212_03130 [Spirochaetia bacterium]|nr:hypothetical protein AGMMS50212_03130 [Spirochaetia bacterium]